MFRLPALFATAIVGAALVPATASADVELGGAISLRLVDSHHATVKFASDALPRKADGSLDARIVMAPGKRPAALKKVGMHGVDTRYESRVTSKSKFRVDERYTVRLKIAGQKDIVRKIRLIDDRD